MCRSGGGRPFWDCVREARDAGYTEPDPRIDLSGEDVRRKLLILARAAGLFLHPDGIRVESLVPEALARADAGAVDGLLSSLDAPLRARYRQRSEEHTSELQSLMRISYAVFCLKKKKIKT